MSQPIRDLFLLVEQVRMLSVRRPSRKSGDDSMSMGASMQAIEEKRHLLHGGAEAAESGS